MSDPSLEGSLPASTLDSDPQEMAEWLESLAALLAHAGPQRVREIMEALAAQARDPKVGW